MAIPGKTRVAISSVEKPRTVWERLIMRRKLIRLFRPSPKKPSQSPFSIHFIGSSTKQGSDQLSQCRKFGWRNSFCSEKPNPIHQSTLITVLSTEIALSGTVKRFVRGDLDGFFALGLDNILMLILMSNLCQGFLGFSPDLFFGKILPASAIGLAIGNVYYWRQALQLAEQENRQDVCALPYGTSILTIIAFVFLAMLPAQQLALADGLSKEEANLVAWRAGLLACFGSGLIEFFGSFIVYKIRHFTPRAALLSTLAGIGFAFIALDFVFRSYAFPLIGITTLGLTLSLIHI